MCVKVIASQRWDVFFETRCILYILTTVIFTGSNACSAKLRYLSYSEGDFEVFCTAGAIHCTNEGKIWHGMVHSSMPNFTPISTVWDPKTDNFTEILPNFGI